MRRHNIPARIGSCILAIAWVVCGAQPQPIRGYIKDTWQTLTRSNRTIAAAALDPKFQPDRDGRWPVYIPPGEDLDRVQRDIRRQAGEAALRKIAIRKLPATPDAQGLLYLPRPYVVPGGRFNEMYGWDSYFIQLGLLHDGLTSLAKDMANNFVYEIRNYGTILNANRTYYMTRSQPPFLTQMLLGVYRKTGDKKWLASTVPAIDSYYKYWTTGNHRTETGLSRYWDAGDGPAPEVVSSERDASGRTHYDAVKEYYRTQEIADYEVTQYYDRARDDLTPLFYKGDRSMRESGFDPSNRFGPFSVDVIHYNPVCLNSLLYLMETEAEEIFEILGRRAEAAEWRKLAVARSALVNRLLWDEAAGLYLDYNFVNRNKRRYPFLTTFYPLWAGIATREQAAAVHRNLRLFERPGGLQTSTNHSGSQWDAPFGWAPLQMIAVEGLRRYGFSSDADRIAEKFLRLVLTEYQRSGTIVEKYDVVKAASDVSANLQFGYRSNEAGFGWTNAVFVKLLDDLTAEVRSRLPLSKAIAAPAR
jgi:alpha,alpha-trehalase